MAKQIMTMRWCSSSSLQFLPLRRRLSLPLAASFTSQPSATDTKRHRKEKPKGKARDSTRKRGGEGGDKEKRRTRSDKDYFSSPEEEDGGPTRSHVPVMLAEVVDVFSSSPLRSFVDCTLGAAGHSSAIIESHQELEFFVGIDVDPIAHEKARARIDAILHSSPCHSGLKVHMPLKNFRFIKSVLDDVDGNLSRCGVDGILMDLGMSSMQVNNPERGFSVLADGPLDMRMDPQAILKAKDILNSWPEDEVGRVLREYGEESNWRVIQNKIVQERLYGGLHYTNDLVDLIRGVSRGWGGRQGWIKTATRVFQALRIAVNDELNTLDESLHACFDCLAPGGRLAVISFHSLEDRIVKQTFLNIINGSDEDEDEEENVRGGTYAEKIRSNDAITKGTWIKQIVQGKNGTILTKRPLTPSQSEEKSNRRSRSAKLRVIEKLRS